MKISHCNIYTYMCNKVTVSMYIDYFEVSVCVSINFSVFTCHHYHPTMSNSNHNNSWLAIIIAMTLLSEVNASVKSV